MTGKRSSSWAGCAALAIPLLLQGCGGGGGGPRTFSEALVADAAGCTIQAEVYTGEDVPGGTCLSFVAFHLFDAAGSELEVETLDPSNLNNALFYPPGEHIRFDLRICRGERQPSIEPAARSAPASTTHFLVPNADRCPEGTVFEVFWGEVRLTQPLQEVSCQLLGRVETSVSGCGS